MDIEIRAASVGDVEPAVRVVAASWGHTPTAADFEDARALFEMDRTLLAFDRGRLVGVAAARTVELTLPGCTTAACAAFTDTGVLPTHRRRGALTALMAVHHELSMERGEPVSILAPSEGKIYRRFGYGVASFGWAVEVDRPAEVLAARGGLDGDDRDALRLLEPDEAALVLPAIYERYRRSQPGEVSRSPAYWAADSRDRRDGERDRSTVVYDQEGYATYRLEPAWRSGVPRFRLEVEEMVAATAPARAALWRYLLTVDLVGTLSAPNLAPDDPLRWLLADPRALRVTSVRDLTWLRLHDVPAAFAARGVESPLAGISLDPADLAAAYLGGTSLGVLARAGRVVELTPGAVAAADASLRSDPLPHTVTDL